MSYVSRIANSILSRTGNETLLGADVYTAIAEWEKREIPASVVLSSIDEVYVVTANEAGKGLPLNVFHETVTRNFRKWLAQADPTGPKAV